MHCTDNLLGSTCRPEDDKSDAGARTVRCSMVDVPKLAQLVAVLAKIGRHEIRALWQVLLDAEIQFV